MKHLYIFSFLFIIIIFYICTASFTETFLLPAGLKYVYGSHPGYQECVRKGRQLVDLTVKVCEL